MATGGDGKGSVKTSGSAATGTDFTIQAPPGSTLVVHEEGTNFDTEVTVDSSGQVKLPAGSRPRDLIVYLKSNPSMWASVSIFELFR
jgi:hypothetical protein